MKKEKQLIIIIDDNKMLLTVLNGILDSHYKVRYFTNGEEAVKKIISNIKNELPALIIVNVIMAGFNGYDVLKALKENEFTMEVPVIMTAADNAYASIEEECLYLGAIGFFRKPLNPQNMLMHVRNLMYMFESIQELKEKTGIDHLTKIFNRRSYDEYLLEQVHLSNRNKTPISLIMIDIDFFKKYNDAYGHAEGDEALRKVAKAMEFALSRKIDKVFRYGGEEFATILPNTDKDGACTVAKKIEDAIFDLQIPHKESEAAKYVTVSMGISTAISKNEEVDAESIYALADKKLYDAKDAGRNRFLQETRIF